VNWLVTAGIAVGLSMDAFAVSIAAGTSIDCMTARHVFRLAFHFGLFQFMMPILGWWAGSIVSGHVIAFGHWLAFMLLSIIAGKMLLDAGRKAPRKLDFDPTRGWMLVALSTATSIDALAAGMSLAFLQLGVLLPCVVIGLTAALCSAVGISFANRLLRRSGRAAELLGACVLIVIAVRILLSHVGATL
jgi:putative Mn2+ efflux pump MntP